MTLAMCRRLFQLIVVVASIAPPCGFAEEGSGVPAFCVASCLVQPQAFDRPHDVELLDDLAIVAGKGGSVAIVDVADPDQPKLIWNRHDTKQLVEAETVLVAKERFFLGTHDFHSIDLSNPHAPVFQGHVSCRKRISHINGMVRRGNTVFAACKHGWLAAFDVGAADAPTLAAAANLRNLHGVASPHDVDLFAEFAVVADPRAFGRNAQPGKLALVRVLNDETGELLPSERWELKGVAATKQLAGANRVQVSGHYVFVGASTRANGGRLVVVDLSQTDSPRQVASLPFAPEDGWGPNGLTVVGQVVFLAGGQSVEAIDVRRPDKPVKLASQRFATEFKNANPRYSGGGDSGHDLVYRNGYLYVTGQNDNCLLILRVESKKIRDLAERRQ